MVFTRVEDGPWQDGIEGAEARSEAHLFVISLLPDQR